MSVESRRLAGILLVIMPSVVFGGVSILNLLLHEPGYMANPLRQTLWRAGHAHAAVLLVLSLVVLRYVDEARLLERSKWVVRNAVPVSAILYQMRLISDTHVSGSAATGEIAYAPCSRQASC